MGSNYKNTGSGSTGGTTTGGGTTTSGTKTYYEKKELFLKGSIVLCQHGFLGAEDTMNPLFQNLRNNVFNYYFNCRFCDGIIRYTELSSSNLAVRELINKFLDNPTKNYFIRTLFSEPKYGDVSQQANELTAIIKLLKKELADRGYPNVPVVLIGYSKGGVVNCKCAIDNKDNQIVDKIVNVGTPHDKTLVQDLVDITGGTFKAKLDLGEIGNALAEMVIDKLVELSNNGVDTLMDGVITYAKLRDEWNNMGVYPKFTPIAAEAIEINGVFKGDFLVPTSSAIAEGFKGKTHIENEDAFIVRDDKVTIETSLVKKSLGAADFVLDILSAASEYFFGVDIVGISETLVDVFANIINNDANFMKCLKLAHCSFPIINNKEFMLNHPTIGMRVLAGLNA
ncbi:MAG: hypothetical protein NC310_02985 [Roseburia sp.]|nr:hypothetical protein [Anaeroplasma bactoclasticum]MCM1196023.1 hypothetical protein [Roseburia sp.]MCM1557083.1 hypothetical protein [Anaeroplasma bactoclasticum]